MSEMRWPGRDSQSVEGRVHRPADDGQRRRQEEVLGQDSPVQREDRLGDPVPNRRHRRDSERAQPWQCSGVELKGHRQERSQPRAIHRLREAHEHLVPAGDREGISQDRRSRVRGSVRGKLDGHQLVVRHLIFQARICENAPGGCHPAVERRPLFQINIEELGKGTDIRVAIDALRRVDGVTRQHWP